MAELATLSTRPPPFEETQGDLVGSIASMGASLVRARGDRACCSCSVGEEPARAAACLMLLGGAGVRSALQATGVLRFDSNAAAKEG